MSLCFLSEKCYLTLLMIIYRFTGCSVNSVQTLKSTRKRTRIAPAKHSQRRDGRFIFPSSSLIFRNRRKGSFVVRKLCGRLTETYNYVFHCRNLFLLPLALLQYDRGILGLGRKNRSVLIAFYRIKKCSSQQKLLNVKVLSLR